MVFTPTDISLENFRQIEQQLYELCIFLSNTLC